MQDKVFLTGTLDWHVLEVSVNGTPFTFSFLQTSENFDISLIGSFIGCLFPLPSLSFLYLELLVALLLMYFAVVFLLLF